MIRPTIRGGGGICRDSLFPRLSLLNRLDHATVLELTVTNISCPSVPQPNGSSIRMIGNYILYHHTIATRRKGIRCQSRLISPAANNLSIANCSPRRAPAPFFFFLHFFHSFFFLFFFPTFPFLCLSSSLFILTAGKKFSHSS